MFVCLCSLTYCLFQEIRSYFKNFEGWFKSIPLFSVSRCRQSKKYLGNVCVNQHQSFFWSLKLNYVRERLPVNCKVRVSSVWEKPRASTKPTDATPITYPISLDDFISVLKLWHIVAHYCMGGIFGVGETDLCSLILINSLEITILHRHPLGWYQ